jgi:hypothetical protein
MSAVGEITVPPLLSFGLTVRKHPVYSLAMGHQ